MYILVYNVITLTAKQAVFPGTMHWMWPDTAFSLTPDSIQGCFNSLHAWKKEKYCVWKLSQTNKITTNNTSNKEHYWLGHAFDRNTLRALWVHPTSPGPCCSKVR